MVSSRCWLDEIPIEIHIEKNVLRYFPKARRLQVGQDWTNEDGKPAREKMVTLDVATLSKTENRETARKVVRAILEELDRE